MLLLLLAAACDGESTADDLGVGQPVDDGPLADQGSMMPDAGPDDPRFVLCGSIASPEGLTSYATVVDSLEAASDIDLEETLPLPGFSTCVLSGNFLITGSVEGPTLTRFTIGEDNSFTESGSLSLMGRGILSISPRPGRFQVISETKAYYIDDASLEIVILNFDSMTIEGSISLDGLEAPEGQTTGISPVILTDDRLLIFSGGNDGVVNTQRGTVAIVDPTTDEVTFDVTERCGGFSNISGFAQDDGTVYVASGTFTSISGLLDFEGSYDACVVRVLPDEDGFDDDYLITLADFTSGALAADVQRGPGQGAYTLVYDETARPITPDDALPDLQRAPVWRAELIEDIASPTATTVVEGLPPTAGTLAIVPLLDRIYYASFALDFSTATLYDVTDPENVFEVASPPGVPGFFAPLF